MIKAVLFDLDGTLCDCTELHYHSLNKALLEVCGTEISRPEHLDKFNGLPTNKKIEMLASEGRVNLSDKSKIWALKQHHTKQLISELLRPDPVKIELHQALRSLGIKVACVTNSIRETASLMLQATGQLDLMDLLLGNDQMRFPKPHPEGYIRGMVTFQSMPEETLIVEDSPYGIQSAKASGANVWEVSGFEEVTLENIKKYLGEK